MRRIKMGNISFAVITMCMVLVSAFCITKTVQSQTNTEQTEMEQYYREQETLLVGQVREYLNGKGFRNSGVMLTRVVEENGLKVYTITVHHEKIRAMDAGQKMELKQELSDFYFPADNCIFYHEFLEAD